MAEFIIEALGPGHDRSGFSCGIEALDRYFREQVTQDMRRRATACYVAREAAGSKVAGYYTLAAGGVPLAELPAALAKKLPRYPSVPVARLGRLAVDRAYRGRKLGAPCCGTRSNGRCVRRSPSSRSSSMPRTTRRRRFIVTTASSHSAVSRNSSCCRSRSYRHGGDRPARRTCPAGWVLICRTPKVAGQSGHRRNPKCRVPNPKVSIFGNTAPVFNESDRPARSGRAGRGSSQGSVPEPWPGAEVRITSSSQILR